MAKTTRKKSSPWRDVFHRLKRNKLAMLGLVILILVLLLVLVIAIIEFTAHLYSLPSSNSILTIVDYFIQKSLFYLNFS